MYFINNLRVNLTSVPQNTFCNILLWKFSNTILHEPITQVQQWSIQSVLFHLNTYSLPCPLLEYFETNLLHHTMIFKVPRKCIKKQKKKKQRYHFADKGSYSQSYGFSSSHAWMWVGPYRRLSTKELMLLNCGAGEDSRFPWTARRSNQSILKEINPEYSLEG